MSALTFELRTVLRSLARGPGHGLAVVLLLGVGIGAVASLFALADAVLLRALPFRDPDSLVWVWSTRADRDRAFYSIPDLLDTRERCRSLAGLAGVTPWAAVLAGDGDVERCRARRLLVAAETALALVLAVGAGLLGRSYARVVAVDPGFDPAGLASARLLLPHAAMGMSLVAGRGLEAGDRGEAARVVVVDAAFAARWWPDGSPVGERLQVGDGLIGPGEVEIVGVFGSVRHFELEEEPLPTLYAPLAQITAASLPMVRAETLIAGTADRRADPRAVAGPLRDALRGVDPGIAAAEQRPMASFVDAARASRRFDLAILGGFALAALLLAAGGLGATTALAVAGRREELGLRAALGAAAADLVRLVLGEAARLAAVGLAAGVAVAWVASRGLRGLLFGVATGDPVVYLTTALAVLAVTLLAAWVPARGAANADPRSALRRE